MKKRERQRAPAYKSTFTVLTLTRLRPKDHQFTVWDKKQAGLGLLVSPGGTKLFRSTYYFRGSSKPYSRRLGRFPEMTIPEARALVLEDRRKARRGIDPKSDEQPASSDSFETVVEQFVDRLADKFMERVVQRLKQTT